MIHGRDIGALALEVSTSTARSSRIHGPAHWRCIFRIAGLICAATPKADPIVCAYFSALHDTQRLSNGTDPEHGRRAAQVVRGLGPRLGLTAKQMSVLVEAIRDHADGRTTKHRTVGACWDADRLTPLACRNRSGPAAPVKPGRNPQLRSLESARRPDGVGPGHPLEPAKRVTAYHGTRPPPFPRNAIPPGRIYLSSTAVKPACALPFDAALEPVRSSAASIRRSPCFRPDPA